MLGGCLDDAGEEDPYEAPVFARATIPTLHGERDVTYAVINGRAILEGDIDLGPVDENGELVQLRGAPLANENMTWPGGEIPYTINPGMVSPTRVQWAIEKLEERTSLRFRPRQPNDDYYLAFSNSPIYNVSHSPLGRQYGGNLVTIWEGHGVNGIIHEIMHSLGFNHEQTRSDRSSVISVNYQCIDDDWEGNFNAYDPQVNLEPYDVGSIMHYNAWAFCHGWEDGVCDNPQCPPITYAGTMQPIANPSGELTVDDINSIYRVYHKPVGANEAGDQFGSAVAHGDFDGDGYDDLAVGVPLEEIGDIRSGAVSVFKGNSSGQIVPWMSLDQAGLGLNEDGDKFGAALAVGDFNQDGFEDLAVGAPHEDIDGISEAGAVFVFKGSISGLQPWKTINQETAPALGYLEGGDHFGAALAAGDFDNDVANDGIRDDLAVGAPDEDIEQIMQAGSVFIYKGSSAGFTPSVRLDQAGFETDEYWDRFGAALAVGRFDSDDFDDLAIGSPEESQGGGSVFVFEGSSNGLVALVHLQQSDVGGLNENGDKFGAALAAGRFRGFNTDDLAVGAPGEDVGTDPSGADAGQVYMFKSWGNTLVGWHNFGQAGLGADEVGDRFGSSLAAGQVWRTASSNGIDLVVGAPGENIDNGSNVTDAGAVFIFSGGGTDMVARLGVNEGNLINFVTNNGFTPGLDAYDAFGSALTVGDFDGDGDGDLVVGIPKEDNEEGAVVHFHYKDENVNNAFTYVNAIQQSFLQDYSW